MVTNIAIRIAVLSWDALEITYLLMQLLVFRGDTFLLSLKLRHFGLKFSYFLFERRVLLARQRKTLAKYCSGATLRNKALYVLKDTHIATPKIVIWSSFTVELRSQLPSSPPPLQLAF